jgi:hypothetical protein
MEKTRKDKGMRLFLKCGSLKSVDKTLKVIQFEIGEGQLLAADLDSV